MTSAYYADRIRAIADEPSRTEKEKLVAEFAADETGRFILNQAYNPFITYGLKPKLTGGQGLFEFQSALVRVLLRKLASREFAGKVAQAEVGSMMKILNADGAWLLYLILSKDLKCGIGENTINAVMPGLIPTFSVMRAHAFEEKRLTPGLIHFAEFKLDGQRNTFLALNGQGGFFTRSGKPVPALDFIVPHVLRAARAVAAEDRELYDLMHQGGKEDVSLMLDGEAMMGLFEDTGAFRRKDTDAIGAELHLYDILSYDDFNADGAVGPEFTERRRLLNKFVSIAKVKLADQADVLQIVPQFPVQNLAEVQEVFELARSTTLASYLARGDHAREGALEKLTIDKDTGKPKVLEGIVVKTPTAKYQKRKCHDWMKMKSEETEDLRIVGVFSGKPDTKYEHMLGGAIVDYKGVHVRVGGGWSDVEREELWKLWEKDAAILGVSPEVTFKGLVFALADIRAAGATNLLSRLIEVEFMEPTPDGSLRHPRYLRFRDDKDGEVQFKEAAE